VTSTRPHRAPLAALRIDRHWLEHHLPHRGRMCLLEEVLGWDMTQIRCRAASHRHSDNPLRTRGCLPAACGIEYAGQAMAAHGALMAGLLGAPARPGYLASVRHLDLRVTRLDDLTEDLTIGAERVAHDEATALYVFAITCAGHELLTGRAGIVFGTFARLDQA
jgi:predicted hotdog family 3-hydroxylacyl-ACP dehydratase